MYRGHYEKEPDMTELYKLRDWLNENGADFEFIDMPTLWEYDEAHPGEPFAIRQIGQHQVIVFDQINGNRMRRWDAICHCGSYGYENGLLEVMGCIVPEGTPGNVQGFLTATSVIEMEKERRKREGNVNDDLISRKAAREAVNDVIVDYIPTLFGRLQKIPLELARAIVRLPAAEPRKGKWINHRNDEGHNIADCDQCGEAMQWFDDDIKPNYCPNCGAKMEESDD